MQADLVEGPVERVSREEVVKALGKMKLKFTFTITFTSRALKTRVKEHSKAIATLDKNSLLAQHHVRYNHQIDLMNVEIVDRSSARGQRLFLEAWHSLQDPNAINEHIALPNVYNNIKNL